MLASGVLASSSDLGNHVKKLKKEPILQEQKRRQNYHMDEAKMAERQQKIRDEANKYRKIMSYSAMKFKNALNGVQAYITPKKQFSPLINQLTFSLSPLKAQLEMFLRKENLHQKLPLQRKCEEETPLVFIKGKIELAVNYDQGLGKIFLNKIINYSKSAFSNVSCLVIATKKKLNKNSIFLQPEEYDLAMAEYLNFPIPRRSSTPSAEIVGKWKEPKNKYLSVVMRNEDTDEVIYWTSCSGFRDLVDEVVERQRSSRRRVY